MSNFRLFTLLATTLATAAVVGAETMQFHYLPGSTALFNGKDLSGWTQKTGGAKYWVEDGCIVGEAVTGTKTNSFLCTEKEYDNFILDVEFKIDSRLNSGVQFRSTKAEQETKVEWNGKTITIPPGYVYGYQAEIDPDEKRGRMWTGAIYDERRRAGETYPGGGKTDSPEGQEFSRIGRQIFKTNDWNHLRLVAVGDSIKTYLNGVLRADLKDSLSPKGFIGLQVHQIGDDKAKEGAQVRFRNIQLAQADVKSAAAKTEAAPNTLTEAEKKAGWRLLWDGKTTEGWRSPKSESFPTNGWVIKGGELTVVSFGNGESSAGGDIITRERFSDFELVVDFKTTPGCNSGIKYFVQPNLDPITGSGSKSTTGGSAIGLEFQVLDDARHPDAKLGRAGNRTVASLYDLMAAPTDKPIHAIGDWNTARILSRGRHVEHWLNGKKVLEYDRGTPEFRQLVEQSKYKKIPGFGEWADGHILLQEHGSVVAFRNVKILVPKK